MPRIYIFQLLFRALTPVSYITGCDCNYVSDTGRHIPERLSRFQIHIVYRTLYTYSVHVSSGGTVVY